MESSSGFRNQAVCSLFWTANLTNQASSNLSVGRRDTFSLLKAAHRCPFVSIWRKSAGMGRMRGAGDRTGAERTDQASIASGSILWSGEKPRFGCARGCATQVQVRSSCGMLNCMAQNRRRLHQDCDLASETIGGRWGTESGAASCYLWSLSPCCLRQSMSARLCVSPVPTPVVRTNKLVTSHNPVQTVSR